MIDGEFCEVDEVPCEVCTKPTKFLATKLCDPCWQLTRALDHASVLASDLRSRERIRALLLPILNRTE